MTGLIGIDGEPVEPLGPFLKRYTPARIFAPGQTPAYSNYATALAGYIGVNGCWGAKQKGAKLPDDPTDAQAREWFRPELLEFLTAA